MLSSDSDTKLKMAAIGEMTGIGTSFLPWKLTCGLIRPVPQHKLKRLAVRNKCQALDGLGYTSGVSI